MARLGVAASNDAWKEGNNMKKARSRRCLLFSTDSRLACGTSSNFQIERSRPHAPVANPWFGHLWEGLLAHATVP